MLFEEVAKNFKIKELPESEIEISGEVPFAEVEKYKEEALKHIAEHLDLPGFRKGHVPASVAASKVGEMAVLEEAAELFIRDFYPEFVDSKKLDVVGRPYIRITKLAPGNPVELSITSAVYPEVKLPKNWKTVAKDIPAAEVPAVEDKEIDDTIENVRQSRHAQAKFKAEREGATDEPALPEINDEFARSIGEFESLDDLKKKVREGITEEKARTAKEKRRGAIIDALLEKVSVAIPRIFVESELDKMVAQNREDVSRFGLTFEDYLKRIQKTEEQLRQDYRQAAEKRAKLQLTLNKIAEEEKVEVENEAVEEEMKHALEHFPDADPIRVRVHIETVLRNEKVLQMLEQ